MDLLEVADSFSAHTESIRAQYASLQQKKDSLEKTPSSPARPSHSDKNDENNDWDAQAMQCILDSIAAVRKREEELKSHIEHAEYLFACFEEHSYFSGKQEAMVRALSKKDRKGLLGLLETVLSSDSAGWLAEALGLLCVLSLEGEGLEEKEFEILCIKLLSRAKRASVLEGARNALEVLVGGGLVWTKKDRRAAVALRSGLLGLIKEHSDRPLKTKLSKVVHNLLPFIVIFVRSFHYGQLGYFLNRAETCGLKSFCSFGVKRSEDSGSIKAYLSGWSFQSRIAEEEGKDLVIVFGGITHIELKALEVYYGELGRKVDVVSDKVINCFEEMV